MQGIVTKFTMKTYPQGQVYGGLTLYGLSKYDEVNQAIANFCANVNDPKAGMIASYQVLAGVVSRAYYNHLHARFIDDMSPDQPNVGLLTFYNGPTPPAGIFDELEAIPHLLKNVKTRSFLDLVLSAPANVTTGQRYVLIDHLNQSWTSFSLTQRPIPDRVRRSHLHPGRH